MSKSKSKLVTFQYHPNEGTMLEQFKHLEQSIEKKDYPSRFCGFISVNNARMIGSFGKEDTKDAYDFAMYFLRKYGDNGPIMEEIYANWGDHVPRTFANALTYAEENDPEGFDFIFPFFFDEEEEENVFSTLSNFPVKLPKPAYKRCQTLAAYIARLPVPRILTLISDNSVQGKIAEAETEEELRDLSKAITNLLTHFVGHPAAGLILRYGDAGSGKNFLNGFRFSSGKVEIIKAKELRVIQETMPDGSRVPDDSVVYQTAQVFLP